MTSTPGRFDELISHIDGCPPESHLVVDIGASCFVSLCAYFKKYNAFEVLQSQGHGIIIHTVITGGVNLIETLNNLRSLARHFDVPIMVWLNPFFGDIKIGNDGFENFKIYHEVKDSLRGIIEMPKPSGVLFSRDFEAFQATHQTFDEAVKNPKVHLMSRQRLVMIWRSFQEAISRVNLV